MAAKGGYTDVLTLLLEETSNINSVDQVGISCFMVCFVFFTNIGADDLTLKFLISQQCPTRGGEASFKKTLK